MRIPKLPSAVVNYLARVGASEDEAENYIKRELYYYDRLADNAKSTPEQWIGAKLGCTAGAAKRAIHWAMWTASRARARAASRAEKKIREERDRAEAQARREAAALARADVRRRKARVTEVSDDGAFMRVTWIRDNGEKVSALFSLVCWGKAPAELTLKVREALSKPPVQVLHARRG